MKAFAIAVIIGFTFLSWTMAKQDRPDPKVTPHQLDSKLNETKLYSDDEIRKLAKFDIDKASSGDKGILDLPCLDVVPSGESFSRAKVFKMLNIEDARVRDFREKGRNHVIFLIWQVSPSYDICCMTATNDPQNNGLEPTSLKRNVYGIRLIKRPK